MAKVIKSVVIGAIVGFVGATIFPGAFGAGGLFSSFGATGTGVAGAFGFSSITVAQAAAIGGGIFGGLTGIARTFVKKPSLDLSTALGRLNLSADPQEPGKWVFGETTFPTDLIYHERHGNNNKQFVSIIVAAAAHRVEEFGTLYIEDDEISFSGNEATGAWANTLWRQVHLGTESQTSFGSLDSEDDLFWPSDARGRGIADYRLRFRIGEQKTSRGIPTRITQTGKGMPVYDPRLDSSRGGSGSHRIDDQDTWEYTNGDNDIGANWALVVLSYLIGWRINGELIFGVGVDYEDIDYDQAMAAANVCDEIEDGIPRFRVGGVFETSNDHTAILDELEGATGGKISIVGGKHFIWAPNDDLSSAFSSISEEELVKEVGVEFEPSGPLEDLFNKGYGQYISPDELYQAVPYPVVEESSAITEDGRERILEQNYSIIQDRSIAERVTRYLIRRSRFSGTWRLAMGPSGLRFRPFDITTLNCQETNFEDVTVRIIHIDFSPTGIIIMELLEEDSSIYNTSDPLGTPITQNDGQPLDPTESVAVSNLSVTNVTLEGDSGTQQDGFKVTWDAPGGFVETTEVQYKRSSDSDYINVPNTRIGDSSAVFEVQPGTTYDIRVRHITVFSVIGDYSTLQPTSGTDTPAGAYRGLNNPDFNDAGRGWQVLTGWSVINDPTNAFEGNFVAKATGGTIQALTNASRFAVSEGDRILGQCMIKKTAGAGDGRIQIRWSDEDGVEISVSEGTSITSSDYARSKVLATAPAGAARAHIRVTVIGENGSTEVFADKFAAALVTSDSDIEELDSYNIEDITNLLTEEGDLVNSRARVGLGNHGYESVARFIESMYTEDGEIRLIDNVLGQIDQLAYNSGNSVNTLEPAETNAEQTTGKSMTVLTNRQLDFIADSAARKAVAEVDSNQRAIIDFTQSHLAQILDNIGDGSTYGRVNLTGLTSSDVDLGKSGVVNKTMDNVADSASRKAVLEVDANQRPIIDFSKTAHVLKELDFIRDGSTFGRVNLTGLTSSDVDLSKSGVINKTADNVSESSSRKWASESGAHGHITRGNPGGKVWNADKDGTWETGDPTFDLVAELLDKSDTVVASRTVRGTLDSTDGSITVSSESQSNNSGYSNTPNTIGNDSHAVRVDVVFTLPGGEKVTHQLSWSSIDPNTAGGAPATGSDK